MRLEDLLQEAMKLSRPCVHLVADPAVGPLVGYWHKVENSQPYKGEFQPWLSFDTDAVPVCPNAVHGWLTVGVDRDSDDALFQVGLVPPHGTPLFGVAASCPPPINAIFLYGSKSIGDWLHSCNWDRTTPYNSNFRDASLVSAVETHLWWNAHPLYGHKLDGRTVFATLGGWNLPWPDDDWYELQESDLLVTTYKGSEP